MNLIESSSVPGMMVVAQIAQSADALPPWVAPVVNGSVLVGWLIYMVKKEERQEEKQDKRHEENINQQKKIESAFQRCITLVTISLEGMKNMDRTYVELASKLDKEK